MARREYSEEFRRDTVKQVIENGYGIIETAERLGVHHDSLRNWIKKYQSPSMSRRGNCYDNAVAESFFKTLKKELVRKTIFHTRVEARDKIFEYIEMFYNAKRRHSFLDFISPNEFEKRYNDSVTQPKVLTE
ncbi:IS3 family transposase [Aliarcobacter cryaerophilus]|uniref:IS3 family transposase n=1 Tax=Aliarcobacter cryaerophilus TaxID=28198 RepID=UPI0021B61006|nr:IS3 family transposase [Aliarcobacter cryaerophilus]